MTKDVKLIKLINILQVLTVIIVLMFLYTIEIEHNLSLSKIAFAFLAVWVCVGVSILLYVMKDLSLRYFLFLLYQLVIFRLEWYGTDSGIIFILFLYAMFLLWNDKYNPVLIVLNGLNIVHILCSLFIFSEFESSFLYLFYLIIILSLSLNMLMLIKYLLDKSSFLKLSNEKNILNTKKNEIIIGELLSMQLIPIFIIDLSGNLKKYNFKFESLVKEISRNNGISINKWYDFIPKNRFEELKLFELTLNNSKKNKHTFSISIHEVKYWFHFEKINSIDFYICKIYSPVRKDKIFLSKAHNTVLNYVRTHEEVSGLYNKPFLISKIEGLNLIIDSDKSYYLCQFKILNFESIIELNGQNFLNKQVRQLAITLENNLKNYDIISRVNDDSFAILILSNTSDIHDVVDRIINILNIKHSMFILSSAYLSINKDDSTDNILKKLNNMINYNVRNNFTNPLFYTEKLLDIIDIDSTCRDLINNKKLYIVAMPLLRNSEIIGAELLTRLDSTVYLDLFFESISRQGLNDQLESLVFENCIAVIEELITSNALPSELSINMLPSTLGNNIMIDSFISTFFRYLGETDIIIEIIEDTFSDVSVFKSISKLKNSGFKIAIDDFGTGYSSLARISKLDIDIVKIDKSLVDDIVEDEAQQTFLNSLVSFLFKNNLDVTVEGIETKDQFQSIKNRDKIKCQGYYFSKPIGIDQYIKLNIDQFQL